MSTIFSILLALLLLACLISFGWGMSRFFIKPKQATLGMKVTATTGLFSALLHFRAIFSMHHVALARFSAAATMYVLTIGLFWWAVRVNRARPLAACFSTAGARNLNTCGPYRLVRHPFYSSYLLAWLSGMIATEDWILLVTVMVMFTIYVTAALREEKEYERGPLAAEYRLYSNRTGQFFPKVWKLNASPERDEVCSFRAQV
jgi:protein-S-isoprenylcysteine O-methyltransferase Ste14